MKAKAVLIAATGLFATIAWGDPPVPQLRYDSPVSANGLIESVSQNASTLKQILGQKEVKEKLEDLRADALKEKKALVVLSYGAQANRHFQEAEIYLGTYEAARSDRRLPPIEPAGKLWGKLTTPLSGEMHFEWSYSASSE